MTRHGGRDTASLPESSRPRHAATAAVGLAAAAALLLAGCSSAPAAKPVLPGSAPTASSTAPVRPAAEVIPGAAILDVTPTFPVGQTGADTTAPTVVLKDESQITEITGLINALPVAPTQGGFCPFDDGAALRLLFRSAAGAEIADVVADATGCGAVVVTIGGVAEPGLSGGATLVDRIVALLGTHWQLTRDSATATATASPS